MPRRNVERLLRDTMVTVPSDDLRRLDIIVSNLCIFRNVSLLCDVTCVSPVTGAGRAISDGMVARSCKRTSNADRIILRSSDLLLQSFAVSVLRCSVVGVRIPCG